MADINSTNLSTEAPDFSMLALFMQADLVVKSVIIILILASLYSWNVIISKILRIRQLKRLEKEFEDIFWSGNSFEDLYETLNFNQTDPKSKLFCAAILEWKKSKTQFESDMSDINSLKDRMMRSMTVVFNKESENVEKLKVTEIKFSFQTPRARHYLCFHGVKCFCILHRCITHHRESLQRLLSNVCD